MHISSQPNHTSLIYTQTLSGLVRLSRAHRTFSDQMPPLSLSRSTKTASSCLRAGRSGEYEFRLNVQAAGASEPQSFPSAPNAAITTRQAAASTSSSPSSRMLKRLIDELHATEQTFVKTLNLLLTLFAQPLHNGAVPGFPKSDHFKIFGNIADLHGVHVAFLKALSSGGQVSQGFADFVVPSLPLYESYAASHAEAMGMIEEWTAKSSAFARFRADQEAKTERKLGLPALMLEPIQRPPRYLLLLAQIVRFASGSAVEHVALSSLHQPRQSARSRASQPSCSLERSNDMIRDAALFQQALLAVEDGCGFINAAVRQRESAAQLIDIQNRLQIGSVPTNGVANGAGIANGAITEDSPKRLPTSSTSTAAKKHNQVPCLLSPGRVLLSTINVVQRQVALSKVEEASRTLVLCSDVLIIVEEEGPKRGFRWPQRNSKDACDPKVSRERLRFHSSYYLETLTLSRTPDYSFVLLVPEDNLASPLIFRCASISETTKLYKTLSNCSIKSTL